MNKVLVLFAAVASLSTAAFANTINVTGILTTSTFLHAQSGGSGSGVNGPDTGATSAIVVDLFANNLTPGMSITIRTSGNFCYSGGVGCTESPIQLNGAFTGNNNNTISAATNLVRLTALATALGVNQIVSGTTAILGEATDIQNDFRIAISTTPFVGTTVIIPTGAQFLVFGIDDARYVDNTDPTPNLTAAIDFDAAGVPEPASIGMIGAGLVALGALARRRRK